MNAAISIVTPAYRSERFIAEGVRSLIDQSFADWRLILVSDDGADYESLLGPLGLADPRIRFLSTGGVGKGAPAARNLALEAIDTDYAAVLDADDRMKPGKLAQVVAALEAYAVVSTALDVMDEGYRTLRTVGAGPDCELGPAAHKFVNLSMDTMIAWDRRRCDARFDPSLSNMADLEFLMQLFRTAPTSFHLGAPLHDYVKVASSMSNNAGTTEGMIRSKTELLNRLSQGRYPMADASGPEGIARFLEISLAAERAYPDALADNPALLFEDHLEPMLNRSAGRPVRRS